MQNPKLVHDVLSRCCTWRYLDMVATNVARFEALEGVRLNSNSVQSSLFIPTFTLRHHQHEMTTHMAVASRSVLTGPHFSASSDVAFHNGNATPSYRA
jgi:hypothetical protein